MQMSDPEFEAIVSWAIDDLPPHFIDNMNNVAIIVEENPSVQQRNQLHLCDNQTLFGLYEGVPLTARGAGYGLVPPDKITIFKQPILHSSHTIEQVKSQVKRTVWHEIAHHYGLDHNRIHELEGRAVQ
jgi:predicted Zn-dependent protease with MMP-like domain